MLESYTSTHPQPHFWEALGAGRFELPRCAMCDEWQPPGAMACVRCGSDRLAWHVASGVGVVYSLLERHPGPGGEAAYILVIELAEGPLLMGSINGPSAYAEVGMPVRSVSPSAPTMEGLVRFTGLESRDPSL